MICYLPRLTGHVANGSKCYVRYSKCYRVASFGQPLKLPHSTHMRVCSQITAAPDRRRPLDCVI
jgi:hypothetical protein